MKNTAKIACLFLACLLLCAYVEKEPGTVKKPPAKKGDSEKKKGKEPQSSNDQGRASQEDKSKNSSANAPQSLRDIIKLCESGVSDDIVISMIEASGKKYDLSADDILLLQDKNVSQKVINALITSGTNPTKKSSGASESKSYLKITFSNDTGINLASPVPFEKPLTNQRYRGEYYEYRIHWMTSKTCNQIIDEEKGKSVNTSEEYEYGPLTPGKYCVDIKVEKVDKPPPFAGDNYTQKWETQSAYHKEITIEPGSPKFINVKLSLQKKGNSLAIIEK